MNYKNFREAQQEAFNKLPIFYAFGEKQFTEQLEKRGIKREEAKDKLFRFGDTGGFYLKTDAEQVREVLKRDFAGELREVMEADHDFAYEAFEYEMFNHEYPINWEGDYDVCSCFGSIEWSEEKDGVDYLQEIGFTAGVIAQYVNARKYVMGAQEW